MPFERGHPKYGGRQAGITKSNLLALLREKYPDFHPILTMLEMYHDSDTPAELRARLLNDIASYTVPRIKPIEFTELQRWLSENISALPAENPIERFIEGFLNGQLSANDLATFVAALNLKRQAQSTGLDEQAELLRLIKG